jgi:hypothetical protein
MPYVTTEDGTEIFYTDRRSGSAGSRSRGGAVGRPLLPRRCADLWRMVGC